jgi:predicted aldo/keto reductase-like oxidoreductase
VKGGSLATLPEPAAGLLLAADPEVSMSSWAVRYTASLECVITVLSGMSNIDQMEDNIKTMRNFTPIVDAERAVLDSVNLALAVLPRVPCTDCRYCVKGCPVEIDIPGVLAAINTLQLYNNTTIG